MGDLAATPGDDLANDLPGAASADRAIAGHGTPEVAWQIWLASADIAELDAGLLEPARRWVVVAPHPDDEVLTCGGALTQHVARGGEVAIVAVTNGEASHPGDATWPPARLAETRRLESLHGLERLGVPNRAIARLGLADGHVASGSAFLLQALLGMLRPTDVVVTTCSFDGHPDHEATARSALEACRRTGCELLEAPVWMWHWASPGEPRLPWGRLRALHLDADTVAGKRHALDAHETQTAWRDDGGAPVLGPNILHRNARDAEYFFV